jgi:hypothetical protein
MTTTSRECATKPTVDQVRALVRSLGGTPTEPVDYEGQFSCSSRELCRDGVSTPKVFVRWWNGRLDATHYN